MKPYRWAFVLAILLNLGAFLLKLAGAIRDGHVDSSEYFSLSVPFFNISLMIYILRNFT